MKRKPLLIHDFGLCCCLGSSKAEVSRRLFSGDRSGITVPMNSSVNQLSGIALESIVPAVEQAVRQYGSDRIAVLSGTCYQGSNDALDALATYRREGHFPSGYSLEKQRPDFPARFIADKLGLTGIVEGYSTACASSASALVSARNLLETGACDAAIVGGVDDISLSVKLGFSALEAVSPVPCNPFSANRSGITLGEGATFFLVTQGEPCTAPFQIIGMGESSDAEHMTAPNAEGLGAQQAMRSALDDAGLESNDIDYLNLHGTGTALNDSMESLAVDSVFSSDIPVSSTKALTGHTLGAAGALELAICCLALSAENSEHFLPPHCWDGAFDEALPRLNFVPHGFRAEKLRRCMSNSFAFGGCNVSLIVERGC